jgi:hypothetical protein
VDGGRIERETYNFASIVEKRERAVHVTGGER